MSIYQTFAADRTHNTLASERTIKADGGLHIYGFIINNQSGGVVEVELRDADDNTEILVNVDATSAFHSNICWLADNGLKIHIPAGGSGDVDFTVFHNNLQGGA